MLWREYNLEDLKSTGPIKPFKVLSRMKGNFMKPEKQARVRYDYHECSKYLENKYGYDERDYAGKYKYERDCKKKTDDKFGSNGWYNTRPDDATPEQKEASDYYKELMKNEPPYQDFWHFIIDHNDIHNGCEFTMHKVMAHSGGLILKI